MSWGCRAIEHVLPVFIESRFLGPAVNALRSLRHFNDYRRRLSPAFAAFPCVHQLPVLLVHLARTFLFIETAVRPPLEHGGNADVKADWPHSLKSQLEPTDTGQRIGTKRAMPS